MTAAGAWCAVRLKTHSRRSRLSERADGKVPGTRVEIVPSYRARNAGARR